MEVEIFNDKANYKMEKIPVSEFVDSVRFIKLETNKECLIRTVTKIFYRKDEIIIVDYERGKIYFFEWNGKYKRKISNKGRGPGEYRNITVCMFDENSETFTIYDITQIKLVVLDIYGKCIREIQQFSKGVVIRDMVQLNNGNYLCYAYDQVAADMEDRYAGLWETDSVGNFVKNYFNYQVKLPCVFTAYFSIFFKLSNGVICLKNQIHSDLYQYQNEEVKRGGIYKNKESKLETQIGLSLSTEINMKCCTFQAKGGYLFSIWSDGKGTSFFAVSTMAKPKQVRYAEAIDFKDSSLPALISAPVDNNHPNILTVSITPFYLY